MASLSCLPPELLAAVFFFLDLPRLLVAGSVCTLWRTLALDCRPVWHDIYVDLSREHAWTWCQRRIDLGGSRIFSLDIDASGERLVNFDAALETLSSSMYRISQLRIKLDQGCAKDLWKALRVPAPELTVFRLEIPNISALSDTVPSNIFGGLAPRLFRVHLISLVLPDSDIPAFARVRAVAVISPIQMNRPFPLSVFRCFPEMQSLQVAGGRMVFDTTPPPQRVIEGVARLKHLDIDYAEEARSVFSCLPVAALHSLLFAFPTRDVVYAALETLNDPGPLQLFLYRQDATEFRMTVTSESSSTSRARTFAESFSDYEGITCERNVLFSDNAFAERLMSLTIATSLWTFLTPFLPSFDQLAKLSLLIDDPSYDAVELPIGSLLCPKLTTLELIAKYSFASISTQQLVDFAAVLTPSAGVCLELYHVVLVGRTSCLEDRFSSISVKDQLILGPSWGQNTLSDR